MYVYMYISMFTCMSIGEVRRNTVRYGWPAAGDRKEFWNKDHTCGSQLYNNCGSLDSKLDKAWTTPSFQWFQTTK